MKLLAIRRLLRIQRIAIRYRLDDMVLDLPRAGKIATQAAKITRLENEAAEREGKGLRAADIEQVLRYHKTLFPGSRPARNGPAWKSGEIMRATSVETMS